MINLKVNEKQRLETAKLCHKRNITIPTFQQLKHPETVPDKIKDSLKTVGLWDVNPANLFRITWKNEPVPQGGLFGGVNYLEVPKSITGVDPRIFCLVGKWFPTGAHKVGATFGCLVPKLITGQFDPAKHKAVWPSTGNFCRGGAYNATLLGCESIAILPEGMSKERFEWLKRFAGEVIATPGCESNVKEIYDKCWELRKTRDNVMIFNQFEEYGNHLWHYEVTGQAMAEVVKKELKARDRVAGVVFTTGSAGTIGAGDFLKERYPSCKIVAGEALQCPTLLLNGFGGHRIEGIGDKHVPWIHNVKNTDFVVAIDDDDCMNIVRLFNEPVGQEYMIKQGVTPEFISKIDQFGISGIGNLVGAIKYAKYYELTSHDFVLTVLTDSMELYQSRIQELRDRFGGYNESVAVKDYHQHLMGLKNDFVQELSYYDRKRVHNLKYYTWIEQQGKTVEELNAQWYDSDEYWPAIHRQVAEIDRLIQEFNRLTTI